MPQVTWCKPKKKFWKKKFMFFSTVAVSRFDPAWLPLGSMPKYRCMFLHTPKGLHGLPRTLCCGIDPQLCEGPLRSLFWLTDAWCKMLNLSEPRVQVWNEEWLASMDKCLINVTLFSFFFLSPSADCHKVHRTGLPYFRVSREVFSSLQMKNSQ